MATFRQKQLVHPERAALLGAFARELAKRMHQWPSRKVLAILWGKFALECGRTNPRKAEPYDVHDRTRGCWNWNVGNIRGYNPQDGGFTSLDSAWERFCDKHGVCRVEVVGGAFRAYPTLAAGVADYVALISTAPIYARAWRHLQSEHPSALGYVIALHNDGKPGESYFTADPRTYAQAVVSLADECERTTLESEWPAEEWPEPIAEPPPDTVPDSPTGKSQPRMEAVTLPTPLVHEPLEPDYHTVRPLEEIEL